MTGNRSDLNIELRRELLSPWSEFQSGSLQEEVALQVWTWMFHRGQISSIIPERKQLFKKEVAFWSTRGIFCGRKIGQDKICCQCPTNHPLEEKMWSLFTLQSWKQSQTKEMCIQPWNQSIHIVYRLVDSTRTRTKGTSAPSTLRNLSVPYCPINVVAPKWWRQTKTGMPVHIQASNSSPLLDQWTIKCSYKMIVTKATQALSSKCNLEDGLKASLSWTYNT